MDLPNFCGYPLFTILLLPIPPFTYPLFIFYNFKANPGMSFNPQIKPKGDLLVATLAFFLFASKLLSTQLKSCFAPQWTFLCSS